MDGGAGTGVGGSGLVGSGDSERWGLKCGAGGGESGERGVAREPELEHDVSRSTR